IPAFILNLELLDIPSNEKVKKPPNAFILFQKDYCDIVTTEYPNLSNYDISIIIGKMWVKSPNEVREKYKIRADEIKATYKQKSKNSKHIYKTRKRKFNTEIDSTKNSGIIKSDSEAKIEISDSSKGTAPLNKNKRLSFHLKESNEELSPFNENKILSLKVNNEELSPFNENKISSLPLKESNEELFLPHFSQLFFLQTEYNNIYQTDPFLLSNNFSEQSFKIENFTPQRENNYFDNEQNYFLLTEANSNNFTNKQPMENNFSSTQTESNDFNSKPTGENFDFEKLMKLIQ
ncbi:9650_t:CDS:1, partial [Racocetra persica]